MPLTPNFTISQNILAPSIITLEDTSTGSDGTIASRRVYFVKADGTYLTPIGSSTDYVNWPLEDMTMDFNVLNILDYALNINVRFLTAGGVVVVQKTILSVFTLNAEYFLFQLTQLQTAKPNIINNKSYYDNKMKLRCCIDEAENAVSIGADIFSAQSALDRAAEMMLNQNNYF